MASDGSAKNGERRVTVKVINSDEEGEVGLSTQNPVVGVEITRYSRPTPTPMSTMSFGCWHRLAAREDAVSQTACCPR